ncbi:inner membrane protein YbjO [Salmonella enterica subsp. enterica serovar Choleraesuis]|nr:inner membrane protein YbjO [Salmonella enterica subsp. enterica serovar Choleraesuis]
MATIFKSHHSGHARLNPPVLVIIAGIGIISTRCLDLLMIFNMLGLRGLMDLIHRSVQTWSLTFVMLSSLLLLFIQFRCAFVVMRGRSWGRWVFLLTQIIVTGYLWAASLGYGYPELFSIAGSSEREILRSLITQKLPDILVLGLLFIPASSRRFFRLQ